MAGARFGSISNVEYHNTKYGLFMLGGSDSNVISGNYAHDNGEYGMYLCANSGNIVSGCTITRNGSYGFYADTISATVITGNTCRQNSDAGMALLTSHDNLVLGNVLEYNDYGLLLSSTDRTQVRGNRIAASRTHGLGIWGGKSNDVACNDFDSNAQYAYAFSNPAQADTFVKNNIRLVTPNTDSGVWAAATGWTFDGRRNYFFTSDSAGVAAAIDGGARDSFVRIPFRLGRVDTAPYADTIAPAAPANVWADTAGGIITLRWSAASTNEEIGGALTDLAGYRIYRSALANPSNWGIPVGSTAAGDTDFTDSIAHGRYYYRVTAYDNHSPWENESWYSLTAVALLNDAPTANAGSDTIAGLTAFVLNGSASTDTNGDTLAYAWTQLSGPDSAGIAGFAAAVATVISGVIPGTYVFQLTVTDSLGASAIDTVSVIAMDSAPPACGSTAVVINGDTPVTTSAAVTLTISSDTLAYQMRIGSDSAFTGSSWETYTTSKAWPLGDTNGVREVWVQFRNYFGIVSGVDFDTITLDTRVADSASVQVMADGSETSVVSGVNITLRLTLAAGTDTGGLLYIVREFSGTEGATWQNWPATDSIAFVLSPGADTKTLYLTIRDAYGNLLVDTTQVKLVAVPTPVSNFIGQALNGGSVLLTWNHSTAADRDTYVIYMSGAGGTLGYDTVIAQLDATLTQYETGPFPAGDSYTFGIRVIGSSGAMEQNTDRQVTVTVVADTSNLTAVIFNPQAGRNFGGDVCEVHARLQGDQSGHTNIRMLFQYRPAGGAWLNMSPTANSSAHRPNPAYPNGNSGQASVHWDISALASGAYALRAVVLSDKPYADSTPGEIGVTIDKVNPSSVQGVNSNGNKFGTEKVDNGETSALTLQDPADTGDYGVTLPAGALNSNTTVKLVIYDDSRAGFAGANRRQFDTGGAVLEITLDNGQTQLNDTVIITIPYTDNNNDSIIDGTRVRLSLATLLYWNGNIWQAVPRGNVTIDAARKVFLAYVRHFSKFATGKEFLGGDLGSGMGDDIPDGHVNLNDLGKFNGAFGTARGHGRFRDDADVNADGLINEEDVFEVGRTYGTVP